METRKYFALKFKEFIFIGIQIKDRLFIFNSFIVCYYSCRKLFYREKFVLSAKRIFPFFFKFAPEKLLDIPIQIRRVVKRSNRYKLYDDWLHYGFLFTKKIKKNKK